MKEYDPDLYRVARLGRFGISGKRVLPQCIVAKNHKQVMDKVKDSIIYDDIEGSDHCPVGLIIEI